MIHFYPKHQYGAYALLYEHLHECAREHGKHGFGREIILPIGTIMSDPFPSAFLNPHLTRLGQFGICSRHCPKIAVVY